MKFAIRDTFLHMVILCLIIYYPLFFSDNYYYSGFDFHIPTNYNGIDHLLFTPIERNGYDYFPHNYLPVKLILFIYKTIFDSDFYYFPRFYVLFLRLCCAVIFFLIVRRYTKDLKIFNIVIFFYLFNLHNLNAHPYWALFYICPGVIYIIIKIYQEQKINISSILFINIWLFFLSIELPNIKFLFYFGICLIFTLFFIKKNFYLILSILLILVSNIYLIFPIMFFLLNTDFSRINIPLEYSKVGGDFHLPDHKYAYPPAILRGYHENFSGDPLGKIFILFNFLSYYIFLVILLLLAIKHKLSTLISKELNFLLLFLIVFSFFTFSTNYIFGFVYDILVNKIYYVRFLRTTSGSAFIFVALFCVILSIFFKYFKNRKIKRIIFLIIVFNSIPIILGTNFKLETIKKTDSINNLTFEKNYVSTKNIPEDYFVIKDFIKNDIRDGNILLSNIKNFNYSELNWISLIPTWFYSEILESNLKTYNSNNEYFYNIKGIFHDGYLKSTFELEFDQSCIEDRKIEGKISYYKIKNECFNSKFFKYNKNNNKCINNRLIVLLNADDKYCNLDHITITGSFYLIKNHEIDTINSSITYHKSWEIRSLDFFHPQKENYDSFIKKKIYSTYLYLKSKPIDIKNFYRENTNYINFNFNNQSLKKDYLIIVNYVEIYNNIMLFIAFVINIVLIIICIRKIEKYK